MLTLAQVSTNYGRTATFAPLCYRLDVTVGPIPIVPAENTITGLVAVDPKCQNRFDKVGIQSQHSPESWDKWMNELDEDGFELSLDEEVHFLTIWLTSMGFHRQTPGRELGQVVAIRIETTHSRSVTFRSPDFHTLPARTLQHQFQSDADEKLTAISWIMNESYECVRAVTSPDENGKIQVLIPERGAPFDQVWKLYFERQNTNGSREGIVTAEAYFRDEAIVGLVFIYASGARTGIGELETDTHQRIQFERHERIVGMSAGALGHSLMEIGFEVGQDEPRYKTLGLPTTSPTDGDPYDGYD
ncbi:hypothetical protein ATEIFO6365_0002006500 [Aspergillus terreus]|uniref:Uncharacterized protein n=1 Tax=Aspergillus terreus TaxID=33178 RepID=A0A5M3YX79_ASPTE|nr:hypothetical protein ATETN484_0004006500 [Aspergillus terreus]GFF12955.1 hypothetical protein ATEIFO6365_0002006500 [Aspergillus terreus]